MFADLFYCFFTTVGFEVDIFEQSFEAEAMTQWERASPTLSEDLSWVPSTQVRWLAHSHLQLKLQGSKTIFLGPVMPALVCTHPHIDTHILEYNK